MGILAIVAAALAAMLTLAVFSGMPVGALAAVVVMAILIALAFSRWY